ncbi:MAG: beta-ketoacyl synthase N-terminal-like domain-containing protein [Myxococcota bacterium]
MRPTPEPIAVVGIGCRYADARGPAEFYEIVRQRRNTVREAPRHRVELGYDLDHFYDPRPRIPGKISSKKGGFLEHPELFDPEAFGIAPRDALTMEPQQRLMIEVTWDALDDAGIPIESVVGERVAVILGYMAEDYSRERAGVLGEAAVYRGHDVFTVGGMSHAVLSGRISFLLGVTGPSLTLDTACSSSLYAAHLACESIRRGESKMAIAGGANLFLSPEGNIALSRSGMLSMSGACKAFDASADGFVRAEGAGVVVLRPLSDALAAGNPIYAVIRGSGISADGRDGGHMMAPGRKGQAQAMRDAYAMAGVSPAEVHYVETHGTGTMIGDPVEIGALADVMGPGRRPDRPLRVASIKGNLGHSESASGVAGLINACLAIHHRTLPPQLHFERPSPAIPWDQVPIQVQRELEPWPYPEKPLVGVNSFGISGTNAHFILEAPPERAVFPRPRLERPVLIPITAHDANALQETAEKLCAHLAAHPELDLRDLAYTLSRRRSLRAHRMAVVASSVDEAREALELHLAGEVSPAVRLGSVGAGTSGRGLVMVFPGQGSQWLGMGRQLLVAQPVFSQVVDGLDAAYRAHVEWSLRAVLEGRPASEGGLDADWTARLDVLQPVLVAVEVALAALWRSFGVEPARVLGQSMGELAAAHVAGALSLEDLARLACERGRLVARASGRGTMAVVSLGRDAVERRLAEGPGGVEIAGCNSPSTTILSGDSQAVVEAVARFESEGVFARRLEVDFASHCFHMDPLVGPFRAAIGAIEAKPSAIAFDSTVDGVTKRGDELDAEYWIRNLREPVAFDRGLAASLAAGGEIFLEVSPHPTLPRAIDETAQSLGHSPRYVSSLRRAEDEERSLLLALAELFVRGHSIDWSVLHPFGEVAPLPLYAYQRKRYFFSERTRLDTFRPTHPLLGVRTDSSLDPRLHSWDFLLDADSGSFLVEVRDAAGAGGATRLRAPDALPVELGLAAGRALWPGRGVRLEARRPRRALELGAVGRRTVQVVLREDGDGSAELRISSRAGAAEPWLLHATATLVVDAAAAASPEVAALVREGNAARSIDDYYAGLERRGVFAGARGRVLRELETEAGGVDGVVGKLMLPRSIESEWYAYHAHPLLLEAAFQLCGALFPSPAGIRVRGIASIAIEGGLGSDLVCRARRRKPLAPATPEGAENAEATGLVADLDFFDRKGRVLGSIRGVDVEALPVRAGRTTTAVSDWHRLEWVAANPALRTVERELDRFILVSDSEASAAWLAAELEKQRVAVRLCEKVEDLEPLVRLHRATGDGRFGFLLLAWSEQATEASPGPDRQREFRVGEWATAIREHTRDAAQIWIATRGLHPRGDAGEGSPLGRRVAREIDTFASCVEMQQCRLFDAERELGELDYAWLASLLGRPGDERQFVMGPEGALVPRLFAVPELTDEGGAAGAKSAGALPGAGDRRRAGVRGFEVVSTGLEGRAAVALREAPERPLGPDEVRVEVRAAALSGLDVLTALGLERQAGFEDHTDGIRALGLDFAGVVTAVGGRVQDLAVGDRVAGIGRGAAARRVVLPRKALARIPEALDFEAAAASAWPALVARHVLDDVARVRAGDRVLVVSAGGGIGLALVARARALGAEVSATASTPTRRALLESLGARIAPLDRPASPLDAATAASSTGAARPTGYDVIVGADPGPALHARLAALAPGGRYVDLCPRDRFELGEVGALRLGANRAYLAVDCLEALSAEGAGLTDRLDAALAALVEPGAEPIPATRFPVAEASRALRFMAQNRHAGRVVLDFEDAAATPILASAPPIDELLKGRRCVVSAAHGPGPAALVRAGLAAWLRGHGAAEVVELDAVDAAADPAAHAAVERRRTPRGRKSALSPIDVWIHLFDESGAGTDPLRHRMAESGATDHVLISLRERVSGEPDRDRAWEARLWLDRLTLAGASDGRGRAIGVSIGGAVGDEIDPGNVLRAFERIWQNCSASDQLVLLPAGERAEWLARAPSPLMAGLAAAGAARRAFDRTGFLALTPPERRAAMVRHVVDELAGVLSLGAERRERLDPASRLDALGLDSLMTMELFMGLGRSLELPLAADWFPPGPTLVEIAQVLVKRLEASLADGR